MSNYKYCPNCGHPVTPDSNNCPNCGTPLNYSGQPAQQNAGYNYPQQQNAPAPRQPKKNNNLIIVLIVIAAVLLLGLIIDIFFLSKDDKQETVVTEQVSSVTTDTTAVVTPAPAEEAPEAVAEPAAPAHPRYSSPYDYVVFGSIGKYKIEMQISIEGTSISGRYRYNRMNGKGGWLELTGGTNGANRFSMMEFTKSGENTGNFDGSFHIDGDRLTMSGDMWNAKGTRYNFNVSGYESD